MALGAKGRVQLAAEMSEDARRMAFAAEQRRHPDQTWRWSRAESQCALDLGAMLKRGDRAPAFAAPTTGGPIVSLSSLQGQIVVLYFFRRAFTRNCTVETKGFRDNYHELRALGAEVVGVSPDEMATQCEFARDLGVTFPLIADSDRSITRSYDVMFAFLPLVHRVTYVIDGDGVIAGVFNHEFQVLKHLDEVLRFVRELSLRRPLTAGAMPAVSRRGR